MEFGDKANFETAFRFASNGLLHVGPDKRLLLFNDQLLRMFDLPCGSLHQGMALETFLRDLGSRLGWNDARTANVIANHDLWMAQKLPTSVEHHFDNGDVMRIACHPLKDGGAVLTYDDVTALRYIMAEHEKAETQARRSERQLALLVSGITDYAIYLLSPDGIIINWNIGAQRAKGYTADEAIGHSFGMFWTEQDRAEGLPQKALDAAVLNGRFECEKELFRKDGSWMWAHILISPLFEEDNTLLGFAKITRDITRQKQTAEKIAHLARHDVLTGLPNRARFIERLSSEIRLARENSTWLAVASIDIDDFKTINDTLGYETGDHALKTVGARMTGDLQPGEYVARFGPDEYIALKPYVDPAEINAFAERLNHAVRQPIEQSAGVIKLGASIGMASYPDDADDLEKLLDGVDLALARAKKAVGEKICYFSRTVDESVRARRALASDLWLALDRGEFYLHYQPQCAIETGETIGHEALIRWKHPIHGMVSPAEFVPIAEECGAIIPIGEWVMRQACSDAVSIGTDRIAVNLSAVQLSCPSILDTITDVLASTGLDPQRLELEVTETAVIADRERALDILGQLKAMGVGLALDDFGTGHSSLDTLRNFPFDRIKIDRSFAKDIVADARARAFLFAMTVMGRSLNLSILAEGVESEEQLAVLKVAGLDEVQGFLLGRPAGIEESGKTCAHAAARSGMKYVNA